MIKFNKFNRVLQEEEGGGEGGGAAGGGMLGGPAAGGDNGGQGTMTPGQGDQGNQVTPWYYAEGIAGEGDKPDYLLEKYSTIDAQAKGYSELQAMYSKTVGGFSGAPEEYKFEASENSNINSEDPEIKMLMAAVNDAGKNANMNNDTYNNIINSVYGAVQEQRANQVEAAIKSIDNFEARRVDMLQMATTVLRPDQIQALNTTLTSAAGFEAVEMMLNAAKGSSLPGAVQTTGVDAEDVTQGVRDFTGNHNDRNKLVDKFNKVYGGDGSQGKLV